MPRGFWLSVIIAAILVVGGMLALGLPGAIYALITAPLVEWIRGLPAGSLLAGDRAWPTAIMMTLVAPPALPLAVWLRSRLMPDAGWLQASAWVGLGVYLWMFAAMLALSF